MRRPLRPRTDLGNAERLVALHGQDLRYVTAWRRWLVWDGRRWAEDATNEAVRRAKDMVRSIYTEAADSCDENERAVLAKWAVKSESRGYITAALELAASEPGIPATPDQLDADPWLLNVANGTLDLRTGRLHPHRREDLITKLAPIAYDPHVKAPLWAAFLARIMGGNLDVIGFLQHAVGYSLTGSLREQVMFVLHGAGANGKSVFLSVLRELLGDYGQQLPASTLMARRGDDAVPTDQAAMRGARLAVASETERGRKLAEALVKQLTGGDRVRARFMRQDFFEFTPTAKIWLATNHKPEIDAGDDAIWRRIRLIPFEVVIPEAERDAELPTKLRTEAPGILAWAVAGCLAWQERGLNPPVEVRAATDAYRTEQDTLGEFLDECCVVDPDASIVFAALYDAYQQWAGDAGIPLPERMSRKRFALELDQRGFPSDRRHKSRQKVRVGLALIGGPRPVVRRRTDGTDGGPVHAQSGRPKTARQQGSSEFGGPMGPVIHGYPPTHPLIRAQSDMDRHRSAERPETAAGLHERRRTDRSADSATGPPAAWDAYPPPEPQDDWDLPTPPDDLPSIA